MYQENCVKCHRPRNYSKEDALVGDVVPVGSFWTEWYAASKLLMTTQLMKMFMFTPVGAAAPSMPPMYRVALNVTGEWTMGFMVKIFQTGHATLSYSKLLGSDLTGEHNRSIQILLKNQ